MKIKVPKMREHMNEEELVESDLRYMEIMLEESKKKIGVLDKHPGNKK